MSDPKTFFWITASIAEVAVINPDGTNMLIVNGLSAFPIKDKPVFSNEPRSLSRNPLKCIILDDWVFENVILANKTFAKALQIFETCVLVNNNLCGKLVSSLDSMKDSMKDFKVTRVPFFIPYFNLLDQYHIKAK